MKVTGCTKIEVYANNLHRNLSIKIRYLFAVITPSVTDFRSYQYDSLELFFALFLSCFAGFHRLLQFELKF